MPRDAFARAHEGLFRRLGEEAFLRGASDPILVIVERGVEQVGEYAQTVEFRSMAHVPACHRPDVDDSLLLNDGLYAIDKILDNDGYAVRCMLRPE